MHKINYGELIIDDFPDGEYSIDWYANINKYHSHTRDYFIKFILTDLATNFPKIIERNIKEIPAIALGSIIRDKSLTTQKIGELYNFYMPIINPQVSTQLPRYIFAGFNSYFKSLKDKNHLDKEYLYNLRYHCGGQTGIELQKNGRTVFFPSYVIAQYFYFRSASLIRQIMSATHQYDDAVKGLYKKIACYPSGNAAILLMPGVSPEDAPEIFRFAVNSHANRLFNQIYRDLANSNARHTTLLNRKEWLHTHSSAILRCLFPLDTDIDITFRGMALGDDYYLALEIIQENSYYPFESLTIFTEHSQNKGQFIAVGRVKKKVRFKQITHKVTALTPHSKFEDIRVSNGIHMDGRLDLVNKNIFNEKIFFESEPEDITIFTYTDEGIDLNSDASESSGDEFTAQMNPAYDPDEGIIRATPKLDYFKQMLLITSVKYDDFSYHLSKDLPFPQYDTNGRRCTRSYLKDNITIRAYVTASINYNGEEYTIIEIEKDDKLLYAPSLILQMKDNTRVTQVLIFSILQNFASKNKKWLCDITPTDYRYTMLIHPNEYEKSNMEDWAKRLMTAFEGMK